MFYSEAILQDRVDLPSCTVLETHSFSAVRLVLLPQAAGLPSSHVPEFERWVERVHGESGLCQECKELNFGPPDIVFLVRVISMCDKAGTQCNSESVGCVQGVKSLSLEW